MIVVNILSGIIAGFAGHALLEKPTKEIFSRSRDVTTLAQYSEGGVLVIGHFTACQMMRQAEEKKRGLAGPCHVHAVADLMLSFLSIGLGTVLAYMIDGYWGKR